MVLTEKQKKELHQAILEYFVAEGPAFQRTVAALKDEADITDNLDTNKGLLEKKWTSVVRLQRKVMELEAKLSLMADTPSASRLGGGDNNIDNRMIPKGPARAALSGHRAPVTSVATHPIYSLIASASEDSTIKLWDYETTQYERTLKGHTGPVTSVCFDPMGSLLASCSADMSAKIWDLSTYQCIKTLRGHDHTLSAVCFLSSGDKLLSCSRDHTIKCWDVNTGYCLQTYSSHSDWVRCISLSADSDMLASGGSDHLIIIWKVSSGQVLQTLRGHDHVVESVCFGKRTPGAAAVMAAAAGASQENILAMSQAGVSDGLSDVLYLASGSRDRTVRLWDALKGQCLLIFTAHENWVRSVLFHPSGKYIISSSDDKSIRIMDIKESRCMRTIADAHSHFVTSIAMSATHPIFISGSVDKNICIWNCG